MALFNKEKFEALAAVKQAYCSSIYIPTSRIGENKESLIRLKNHRAKIEKELVSLGMDQKEIKNYLDPIDKLINDQSIWRNLSDALTIFRSQDEFHYTTLPLEIEEFSLVSDQFYLLPLLPIFHDNRKFFLLVLSQNGNQLFEATRHIIEEVVTEDELPEDKAEAVGKDVKQKSLQFRTSQTGEGLGLFHGKGEGKDDKEKETYKYLKELDHGLNQLLEGYNIPLVVAAVDHVFSKFKEVSSYPNVYPEPVAGNYDEKDVLLVHEKACDLLSDYFEKTRNKSKAVYGEEPGKTVEQIDELVTAANNGSIETLFIEKNQQLWGIFKPEEGKVEQHIERDDHEHCLLDIAARSTFLQGGNVFLANKEEMPGTSHVANAILRY